MHPSRLLPLFLLLAACGDDDTNKGHTGDTDSEADSDTDTDTDTDTDSDADTDADTDFTPQAGTWIRTQGDVEENTCTGPARITGELDLQSAGPGGFTLTDPEGGDAGIDLKVSCALSGMDFTCTPWEGQVATGPDYTLDSTWNIEGAFTSAVAMEAVHVVTMACTGAGCADLPGTWPCIRRIAFTGAPE